MEAKMAVHTFEVEKPRCQRHTEGLKGSACRSLPNGRQLTQYGDNQHAAPESAHPYR